MVSVSVRAGLPGVALFRGAALPKPFQATADVAVVSATPVGLVGTPRRKASIGPAIGPPPRQSSNSVRADDMNTPKLFRER